MREVLVTELVKEVLGPRGGIHETLNDDENPLTEYITGVLAPIMEKEILEIESQTEIPIEDTQIYEGETEDADVGVSPLFYPALDPKSRPPSMGLSFVVEADGLPQVDVCLTWARYKRVKENGAASRKWQREPRWSVFPVNLDSGAVIWIDHSGTQVKDIGRAEISFHVIIHSSGRNRYLVNLYFVNRIRPPAGQHVGAEHYIFQPQIRIAHSAPTMLVPSLRKRPQGEEEQELEFLYRNKPVLARGHLCSALWSDIDPEKVVPSRIELDSPGCTREPPFYWLDGELLPRDQRNHFCPPDVRTEFVPIYSIPFPDFDRQDIFRGTPKLNAHLLAEMWKPEALRDAVLPLSVEYKKWIELVEEKTSSLAEYDKEIAHQQVSKARIVLQRIDRGISILQNNDDARLAFCFANEAINTQWKWVNKSDFLWRPFQMAFILMTIESIVNKTSQHRNTCDILWVPTGGGKTEAYLAIVAFTIAYRRRKTIGTDRGELTGSGISVMTRYTLRLLTIQQFRRALSLLTACEFLRVCDLLQKKPVGWRPSECHINDGFLWGSSPFEVGMWVGGGVSPNRLKDGLIPGALSILRGIARGGEPAQILNCPACSATLAIPEMGLQPGKHTLHWVVLLKSEETALLIELSKITAIEIHGVTITCAKLTRHNSQGFFTLTFEITSKGVLRPGNVDELWKSIEVFLERKGCQVELVPAHPSRMGYFIRYYIGKSESLVDYDFEIFCPNPECDLHKFWCGGTPTGWVYGRTPSLGPCPDGISVPLFPDGNRLIDIQDPFTYDSNLHVSDRIPIPALTVEEQLYRRLPAVVVATVDKFARPPFDPQAASLFGNVEFNHCIYGYYRRYQHSSASDVNGHPGPVGIAKARNYSKISCAPEGPDLIIQDELHLIEGPLGSLVGLYETAVDFLCGEETASAVKYIASTATIRRAKEQTRSVFARDFQLFPPQVLESDDRFFMKEREIHALDDKPAGRLYAGICAPGRGPLTPLRNIWARLLQKVWELAPHSEIDAFWTLTGYFNAVRELAGARALYRQDIPLRVDQISAGNPRSLKDENTQELSSRSSSTDLPSILDILSRKYPKAPDALFTTSMFGTGVDIRRIGLMVVNGQPKTTSAYIQSTGRVGRSKGALVVTFFRASRPRDLSHYEFFMGYHRQLHRYVEPITVHPFSPTVLERTIGPLEVFILRNMRGETHEWHRDDSATIMATARTTATEVKQLPSIIEQRAQGQPALRRPEPGEADDFAVRKLDAWQSAAVNNRDLRYVEYAIAAPPKSPVILGDYQHQHSPLIVVYENAPRSLRDIEETTGFQT